MEELLPFHHTVAIQGLDRALYEVCLPRMRCEPFQTPNAKSARVKCCYSRLVTYFLLNKCPQLIIVASNRLAERLYIQTASRKQQTLNWSVVVTLKIPLHLSAYIVYCISGKNGCVFYQEPLTSGKQ